MNETKRKKQIKHTLENNYFNNVTDQLVNEYYTQFKKEIKDNKLFYNYEIEIYFNAFLNKIIQ